MRPSISPSLPRSLQGTNQRFRGGEHEHLIWSVTACQLRKFISTRESNYEHYIITYTNTLSSRLVLVRWRGEKGHAHQLLAPGSDLAGLATPQGFPMRVLSAFLGSIVFGVL